MKKLVFFAILLLAFSEQKSQELSKVEPAFTMLTKYSKVRDFTMSKKAKEAYITIQSPSEELAVIARIKLVENKWTEPEIVSFSGKYKDLEPFLSPNGLTLYFVSTRPKNDSLLNSEDYDIWFVTRKNVKTEWSKPTNIGFPINTKFNEFYPTIAKNKNLYFTRNSPETNGKDDIFFSEWKDEKYLSPIPLSDSINSAGYEFNSFISPDESFIIYSGYNRKDGYGSADLYISFKNKNGVWIKSVNLGKEINSPQLDYCPFVDLTTGELYFTSRRSGININKTYSSIKEFESEINKYENGFSRIYKTSIREILLR